MVPVVSATRPLKSREAPRRIKDQLDARGRTQHWLSHQTGISERSISYWMQGRCKPGLESIEIVARALNVSPGWLAFGEESL
jgi:transcriptional regulator with XRE-family HTH domain